MRATTLLRRVTLILLMCLMVPVAAAQEGTITLNLQDADIRTLIATVGEITGRNFVVDPRVKGQVTVISSTPMTPQEIYQTFLSILQVHGFAAIPSGSVTEIVPEVSAKQSGGVPLTRSQTVPREEIITRVLRVENVPAAQLVPILRPLVPQYGHLAAYPPSNMLIISDRAGNVGRIVDIVQRLDSVDNRQVTVIALENASAASIITSLTPLLQQVAGEGGGPPATAVADERTNSIILSGDASQVARVRAIVSQLDAPVDRAAGDTQVIYLNYAEAESLADVLTGYLSGAEAMQAEGAQAVAATAAALSLPENGANVIAAQDINALVVTAPPETMREIRAIVSQLDIRRAQVLVQAVIAEVSANTSRELGINWAILDGDRIAGASLPGLDQGTISQIAGSSDPNALLGLLQPGGITLGGGLINPDGTSFAILLRALYSDADTNILSTPTLVTMDNQEAEISVGQQVPFLTGSFTSGVSGGEGINPFQTIEREQVGLTLQITPQINKGNSVQLTIDQEVSSLSAGSQGVNAVDLITNNRTLNTTVSVQSGDILVLGGLIDSNVRSSERAVPILGQIPLLGSLFRYRSYNRDKRNLMVFIRPIILRDRATANYYTRQKYNTIRDLQIETRASQGATLGDRPPPVLPELEDYPSAPPPDPEEEESPFGPPTGPVFR